MAAGPGSLPPRRVDQQTAPGAPGLLPAPSGGLVVANRVVIFGPFPSGLYVYSPSQGPGKLRASIASMNGADLFGNPVFSEIASYSPGDLGIVVRLSGGGVIWQSLNPASTLKLNAAALLVDATGPSQRPYLNLSSPASFVSTTSRMEVFLFGESSDGTQLPQTLFAASFAAPVSADLVEIQGNLDLAGGQLDFGPINAAPDVSVQRNHVGGLLVSGATANGTYMLTLNPTVVGNGGQAIIMQQAADYGYAVLVQGDTLGDPRWRVHASGNHVWGAGGVSLGDTTLYRAGPAELAADPIALNVGGAAETLHNANGALPAGWGGNVDYWKLNEIGGLVFINLALSIANGTIVTNGELLATLPAGYFYSADNRVLLFNISGNSGALANGPQPCFLSSTGRLTYSGVGFTAGAGSAFLYGSAVYTTAVD